MQISFEDIYIDNKFSAVLACCGIYLKVQRYLFVLGVAFHKKVKSVSALKLCRTIKHSFLYGSRPKRLPLNVFNWRVELHPSLVPWLYSSDAAERFEKGGSFRQKSLLTMEEKDG